MWLNLKADTRIFIHAIHAVMESNQIIMIKADYTDIVLTEIFILPSLQELGLHKVWIAFSHGTHLK